MKIFVTGGSGFLGRRLKLIKPEWIYLSSKDLNLFDYDNLLYFLRKEQPEAVIHLAAKVGGIKYNAENPADFYSDNCRMNLNIVKACQVAKVPRLLAALSTCAFPDTVSSYPFKEEDIFSGPPSETNLPYGYTKRSMFVHINTVRKQYGLNYSCFCPSNLYGPEDSFDLETSHFVSSAIRKIKESNGFCEFWGTGNPMRQQLYVDDLARAIPLLLKEHNSSIPIIVAPNENLTIKQMINIIQNVMDKDVNITFNGKFDGQFRKDGSNERFIKMFPEFKFTSFYNGIKDTINWYEKSIYNRN